MLESTKHKLVYLLMVLTTLPFLALVSRPEGLSLGTSADQLTDIAYYASAVAGYVGISLLVWQFVLGTRSVTGLYFRDLAWTIKVHTLIGKYGTLLIFIHPFLIAYAYGESILYPLLPDLGTEFETHVTIGRFAFMVLLVIWLSSAIVRGKIAYRPWKYLHYFAYLSLPAVFLHAPDIGESFGSSFIQFYWYSFILIFLAFVVLRARHLFGYGKIRYAVVSNEPLTPEINQIVLESQESRKLGVEMGQYVYLQPSLISEEHPFSVVNVSETGQLTIAYKVYGKFTNKLAQLASGGSLYVDGPYGVFTSEISVNSSRAPVFLAGGIGITPFVEHVLRPSHPDIVMFYANRSTKLAAYRDLLRSKLGDRFIDVVSESDEAPGPNFEVGYLSAEMLSKYVFDINSRQFYICGPPAMLNHCKKLLAELGVPKSQITVEEFSY